MPQNKCKTLGPEASLRQVSSFLEFSFFSSFKKVCFLKTTVFQVRANFKAEYEILNINFKS